MWYMCHRQSSGRSFKLTDPIIMDRFIDYVRNSEVGARLHLLAVDFYPERIASDSPKRSGSAEVVHKHSTLNYCLLALTLLRPNGSFIVKIYMTQQLFTVGLLYLMYRCFDKISVVKPNSCRSDNSEGYLICKWKKHSDQTEIVRQYLYNAYMKLNDLEDTNLDVMQLVPVEVLESDKTFFDYVYKRNETILRKIIQCWQCIKRYSDAKGPVYDPRRSDFKQRCIRLWDIPPSEYDRSRKFNWRKADNVRAVPATDLRKIDNWRKRND